jgi:hypothetical protein
MDFTYPTDFIFGAFLSFAISMVALLVSVLSRRSIPRGYSNYIAVLVVIFCAAISLRWSDWRQILLTVFGLMDLGIILGFSAAGAFTGVIPLRLFGERRTQA